MERDIDAVTKYNNAGVKKFNAEVESGASIPAVGLDKATGDKMATDAMKERFLKNLSELSTYYYEDGEITKFVFEEIAPYLAGDHSLDEAIAVKDRVRAAHLDDVADAAAVARGVAHDASLVGHDADVRAAVEGIDDDEVLASGHREAEDGGTDHHRYLKRSLITADTQFFTDSPVQVIGGFHQKLKVSHGIDLRLHFSYDDLTGNVPDLVPLSSCIKSVLS